MPFADEPISRTVDVVAYRPEWASEGLDLTALLRRLLPGAAAVDHIGSTAVPGLPAKDCLDAMVRVDSLTATDLSPLIEYGFRERPEDWNQAELMGGRTFPKRVFAPPIDGRPVNIHIRESASATARYALLFRDFLRADAQHRDVWGRFKLRLAQAAPDVYVYGQVKAEAQPLLMTIAERWATENSWHP